MYLSIRPLYAVQIVFKLAKFVILIKLLVTALSSNLNGVSKNTIITRETLKHTPSTKYIHTNILNQAYRQSSEL